MQGEGEGITTMRNENVPTLYMTMMSAHQNEKFMKDGILHLLVNYMNYSNERTKQLYQVMYEETIILYAWLFFTL